jgi:lysyl-tRNA synthetase class 2
LAKTVAQPSPPSAVRVADSRSRVRRVRAWTAAAVAALGLANLLSAVTPPLEWRLRLVRELLPTAVLGPLHGLTAFLSVGLVLLARGLRRGNRLAYSCTVAILVAAALLNLFKALDYEEAALDLLVAGMCLGLAGYFDTSTDLPSLSSGLAAVAATAGVAEAGAIAAITLDYSLNRMRHHKRPAVPFQEAARASLERFLGLRVTPLPPMLDRFLTPALEGVTAACLLAVAFLVARPALLRTKRHPQHFARAQSLVFLHPNDSLDYFALRDDKSLFFAESGFVSYAVFNGVCVVSPDPVVEPGREDTILSAFLEHADRMGWPVVVLAAGARWVPIYRAHDLSVAYIGDEALVDVTAFDLAGKRHKSLRQACSRVRRYGYRAEIMPAHCVPGHLRRQVAALVERGRRGEGERGFSMTLSRFFDERDTGLVIALVHDPDGGLAAFAQFVPAPAWRGYSLDVMRRDKEGSHPNGVVDFLLVSTIERLREAGCDFLSLNFAAFRRYVAPEDGRPALRLAAAALRRLSESAQIESLYRFNSKYDPLWVPRYVAYQSLVDLPAGSLAVARAESLTDLPVVGAFLKRNCAEAPLGASLGP